MTSETKYQRIIYGSQTIPDSAKPVAINDAIVRAVMEITQDYRPRSTDRLFFDQADFPGKHYALIQVDGQSFVGSCLSNSLAGAGISFLRAISEASVAGKSPNHETTVKLSAVASPRPPPLEEAVQSYPTVVLNTGTYESGYGHGV